MDEALHRIRLIWHISFMEKINTFKILFGIFQKKKQLVRPRCKWEGVFVVVISWNNRENGKSAM
jgi:hypothetical protein